MFGVCVFPDDVPAASEDVDGGGDILHSLILPTPYCLGRGNPSIGKWKFHLSHIDGFS